MPYRHRRKFSRLYDVVVRCGLSDAELASLVRLQSILHQRWRADPGLDLEDVVLTVGELQDAAHVYDPRKARAKLVACSGASLYGFDSVSVEPAAQVVRHRGAHPGARTVRVKWSNLAKILHVDGPESASRGGRGSPHQGQGTKGPGPPASRAAGKRVGLQPAAAELPRALKDVVEPSPCPHCKKLVRGWCRDCRCTLDGKVIRSF